MTWDVPTAQDCPSCGQTMFKKSGRGQMKPFCINEKCPDFLPEDKRGYKRRMPKATTDTVENAEEIAPAAEETEKKARQNGQNDEDREDGQGRQGRKNCEDHEKSGGEKACRTQKDKNGERSMTEVRVIGAGLAGSEAAWQLAERGFAVRLSEMKPVKMTPAHHCADFAELVCSNSLRGDRLENAVGLLKEELRRLGSLILQCADATRVEAGGCLAVDRYGFSGMVTERIRSHPNITVISEEVTEVPAGPVSIATGPLTSDAMSEAIGRYFGQTDYLHFFDAAAPLVTLESIDMTKAWYASRYDRGSADYINCAMTREEYQAFVRELAAAEEAEVHGFEDKNVFEGCMPVEVMARRGEDTLRYGPLKPVGLRDPATRREPYAVVQPRRDNAAGNINNLVGFQTHLRFPEQKRVFSMIPALHDAEFVRYGVMHRNTFLNSPKLLDACYADRRDPMVAFAGQMTGVEGYVESCASGYLAAVSMAARLEERPVPDFGTVTAIGALAHYVSDSTVASFQPMNVNFGIIAPLEQRVRGKANKNLAIANRSLAHLEAMEK